MKLSVYIATSVDGFIAREDGAVDWLDGHESAGENEDFGYKAFMDSVDGMLMGRNTYDKVLSFDVGWPYGDKPVFVLTKRPFSPPDAPNAQVEPLAGSPHEIVSQLNQRGFTHLYIDGGQVVQQFLQEGLVDELIITVIPVLLGKGIPLFGALDRDQSVKLMRAEGYSNGFVQTRYVVERPLT
ncbi:MAG: dihydrofolate reductase family protein [Chloroflexota bacterium]